jgi:hypothetical protein
VEPLRTAENNIADLNDYETEVDDIIFHLEIEYDFPEKSITQSSCLKSSKK